MRPITHGDVQTIVDAMHQRGRPAFVGRIDAALANSFPYSNESQRRLAIQDALRDRALVMTPMGDIRRPPAETPA